MGLVHPVASSGFSFFLGSQFGVAIEVGVGIVTGTGAGIVAGIGIEIVIGAVIVIVFGIVTGIVIVVCLYGLFSFGSSYYVGR